MAEGGAEVIGDAVLGIFPSEIPGYDVRMRERALGAVNRALCAVEDISALGQRLQVGIVLQAKCCTAMSELTSVWTSLLSAERSMRQPVGNR